MSEQRWHVASPDDRVWVRLKPGWTPDPDIRWRIDGNAHTHRGHFYVSTMDGTLTRTVNATDVVDASPEASLWLDGFLRGQEATLFEFMGSSEDLLERVDDGDLARWQDWNARFRANGSAPALNRLPAPVDALSQLADPQPWCFVASRYWVFGDGAWAVAAPQPGGAEGALGWAWPNTACALRGQHSLAAAYGPVLVCEDCHEVSAVVDTETATT